ncbi:MAG: ISNCY family transposase, partial [Gallionella sp.]
EVCWQKRKLSFSVQSKPVRQSKVADGKAVNARVDKAVIQRNTGHPPAAHHPWRKLKLGKAAHAMTA